jgi:hypothetical protein
MTFYNLLPTLLTIVASMLVVRAGAIALVLTGMSYDKAKFQALSAFSGTGFTTKEAERVVNHPVRRKIVTWLIILGNAGIVTVIVSATSAFTSAKANELGTNILFLMIGILVIASLARYSALPKWWETIVSRYLRKKTGFSPSQPVEKLLHLKEGYGVAQVEILEGSSLVGETIAHLNNELKSGAILGLERDGEWIPNPHHNEPLEEGDFLTIYGQLNEVDAFFKSKESSGRPTQ